MSKTNRPRSLTLGSIQPTLLSAEEQKSFDEYSLLGEDLDSSGLTYVEAAQAEVMLSDE